MTKELKALESMKDCLTPNGDIFEHTKEYKDIHKAIQRLEAIDNAKPSKALEFLKQQAIAFEHSELAIKVANGNYDSIKQALIKSQEQEKVLEIIFEKGLSLTERDIIKQSENYKQYQIIISWWNYKPFMTPKTEEEFYLLKRYCDE